ncbi:MAG: hypothetical protein IJU98_08110 [Synergistaceae bacterium]|nr:hypothetical protein [Synergistaceae bacterium]
MKHASEQIHISNACMRDLIGVVYHLLNGLDACVPKEHSLLEDFLCERGVTTRFIENLFTRLKMERNAPSIEAIYEDLIKTVEGEAE